MEKDRVGGSSKGKDKANGQKKGKAKTSSGRGRGGDASSSSSSNSSRNGRTAKGKERANESKGVASSSQEQSLPAPDVSALVGTTVHRKFGDIWYSGVVSVDDGWYRVTYEDGDADDLNAVELQQLVDGSVVGATISYNAGSKDSGWSEGIIQEPYKQSKHGAIWIPVDQQDKSWSGDRCFLVDFADGYCPIDLRSSRRVSDPTDAPVGSWYPLEDPGIRT